MSKPPIILCTICNMLNPYEANFCKNCGNPLAKKNTTDSSSTVKAGLEQFEKALQSKNKHDVEQAGIPLIFIIQETQSITEGENLLEEIEKLCIEYDNNYFPALGNQLLSLKYIERGDFAHAEVLLLKAREFVVKAQDKKLHLAIQSNLAGLAQKQGDLEKAIHYSEDNLEIDLGFETEENQYMSLKANLDYLETLLLSNHVDKVLEIQKESSNELEKDFIPFVYFLHSFLLAWSMLRYNNDQDKTVAYLYDAINICMLEKYKLPTVYVFYLEGMVKEEAQHYVHAVDPYKRALQGSKLAGLNEFAVFIQARLNQLVPKMKQSITPTIEKQDSKYNVTLQPALDALENEKKYYDYMDIESSIRLTEKYSTINQPQKCQTLLDRCKGIYRKYNDEQGSVRIKEIEKSLAKDRPQNG